MMHLLALLEDGTHGPSAEPSPVSGPVSKKCYLNQRLTKVGTCGTCGTRIVEEADAREHILERLDDLRASWHERVAICLEAGDIGETEARHIADAEIGRRLIDELLGQ